MTVDPLRLAKFTRGPSVATRKVKDKKLKGQLQHTEGLSKAAALQAAKAEEWLLPNAAGALETEGMERSYRLSQVLPAAFRCSGRPSEEPNALTGDRVKISQTAHSGSLNACTGCYHGGG